MRTINIVGYKTWYSRRPWCRGPATPNQFSVTFDQSENNVITYFKFSKE